MALDAFSVTPSTSVPWKHGRRGPGGPLKRAQAPTETTETTETHREFFLFLAPKKASFGLDLGGGCMGAALIPVQMYATRTEAMPLHPNVVRIAFILGRVLSRNGKQSNSVSSVLTQHNVKGVGGGKPWRRG